MYAWPTTLSANTHLLQHPRPVCSLHSRQRGVAMHFSFEGEVQQARCRGLISHPAAPGFTACTGFPPCWDVREREPMPFFLWLSGVHSDVQWFVQLYVLRPPGRHQSKCDQVLCTVMCFGRPQAIIRVTNHGPNRHGSQIRKWLHPRDP